MRGRVAQAELTAEALRKLADERDALRAQLAEATWRVAQAELTAEALRKFADERDALTLEVERLRGELQLEKDRRVEVRSSNQYLNEVSHALQKDLQQMKIQLAEATGLLRMFESCCADEPRETLRAFLSRAPAQATEAERLRAAIASTDQYLSGAPAQAAEPWLQKQITELEADTKEALRARAESSESKLAACKSDCDLMQSQKAALSRRVLELEGVKPLLDALSLQAAEAKLAEMRDALHAHDNGAGVFATIDRIRALLAPSQGEAAPTSPANPET
jgi:peroxiredoxin family protein